MIKYILIVLVLLVLLYLVWYINARNHNRKDEELYDDYIKKIKKSFVNLLIKIESIPDPNGKKINNMNHIDDLVDLSLKVKKPIYYVEKGNRTCDFILIEGNVYNIYKLKLYDELISSFDVYMSGDGNNKKRLFDDLVTTTIIKMPNGEVFKVSPLKKRNKESLNIEMPKRKE